jgi:peptidoglycan/xylan/chitin deacetylase (PgdA/CDA1 family)
MRALPSSVVLAVFTFGCGVDSPTEQTNAVLTKQSSEAVVSGTILNGDLLPDHTLSLTYDDGPDGPYAANHNGTLELSQYLYDQGIRATFFLNGCRFVGSPAPDPLWNGSGCLTTTKVATSVIASITSNRHRVANHTEDHPSLTDPGIPDSVILSQARVPQQSYVDPSVDDGYYLLRPPGGNWNQHVADVILSDPNLNRLTGPINWDVVGGQAYPDGIAGDVGCFKNGGTPATCGQRYLTEIESRPHHNGVVLLHTRLEFNPNSENSLLLSQWLIPQLRTLGYKFVPLDAIPNLPGTMTSLPASVWSAHFSDAEGWSTSGSFETIRFGDLDADGKADVCGRSSMGVRCAKSNGTAFADWTVWTSADYTDAAGWAPLQYGSTLQLGDITGDGKADLCGRGSGGMLCAASNGSTFGTPTWWTADFSNAQGWDTNIGYYGTIRLADVNGDGKADVCGRKATGLYCALSTGTVFLPVAPWKTDDFTDALGWLPPEYSTTIQFAKLNADAKVDVCGRGSGGMLCALSNGSSFGGIVWTPHDFGDSDEWQIAPARYRSIGLADVNGDSKADACGRNPAGIACSFSNGDGSFRSFHYLNNADFRDDQGWSFDQYGTTVRLANVDGAGGADICGRSASGIRCARTR